MATNPEAAITIPVVSAAATGSRPSKVEEEVVAMFEQHRGPLLRYLLSFRIAAPDAEEIVQEVFLSLFQHLRRGKSRANLHGWLFKVAHNLALKNRIRAQRQSPGAPEAQADSAPGPELRSTSTDLARSLPAPFRTRPGANTARGLAIVSTTAWWSTPSSTARRLARLERRCTAASACA